MKLRNFLYINSNLLNDYISAIDGHVYEEETINNSESKNVQGAADGNIVMEGAYNNTTIEETKKNVKITESAKFDKIFKYIKENETLRYYERFEETDWKEVSRDDFVEVLVVPRFSKLKEITNLAKNVGGLIDIYQEYTDRPFTDKKGMEAIKGFSALDKANNSNEIPCVFNFDNSKYPIVSYLDEAYFKTSQERFVGQVYMLCKIQRKIEKGEKVELDDIFSKMQKMPMNRQQRKAMQKEKTTPMGVKDQINGPAFVTIPIAVYQ